MSDAEIKTMLRRQILLEEQANFSRALFLFCFFFQIYQVRAFSLQRSPQKGSISLFGSPSRSYLGHVLHVFGYHWYCHPLQSTGNRIVFLAQEIRSSTPS